VPPLPLLPLARFLINVEGLLSHLDFISRLPTAALIATRRPDAIFCFSFSLSLMFASDDHFSIPSLGQAPLFLLITQDVNHRPLPTTPSVYLFLPVRHHDFSADH